MTEMLHELPDAWKLAIQREQSSQEYYSRMAHSASDAATRALFESLAAQEAEHQARLEEEFRRVFQADLDQPRARSGVFEHDLHRGIGPTGFSWWRWEEDSFRLARELDVPILLSISATWCHWCHEMDKTYGDPDVAALINEEFIAIRVDTDERPDINRRYNMGGWPTTAFLTPNGDLLTGATYLTPDQFVRTGRQVADYYRKNKGRVRQRIRELGQAGKPKAATRAGELVPQLVQDVIASIAVGFDPEYGGFGTAPKFPQTDALSLALDEYQTTGDPGLGAHLRRTLRHMAEGGLFDPVEGGFFRYSTTRDWQVPHYEKMSEDNAQLLTLYVSAYQVFGDKAYRRAAEKTADYVLATLYDPLGHFCSSQDADEEYYKLDAKGRAGRQRPFVDKTAYAGYNATMASAMMHAGLVLDRRDYTDAGLKALDSIWDALHVTGRGLLHARKEGEHVGGFLSDQVWGAMAMLDAYERAGDPRHLARAQELMDYVYAEFAAGADAGFWDAEPRGDAFGRLRQLEVPILENSVAALAALRLHAFTGEDKHRQAARSALTPFGGHYKDYSYGAARYAAAVHAFLSDPIQIIIVGTADDAATGDLRRAALRVRAPYRILQVVDPTWEQERLKRLGYPAQPALRAYVCTGLRCVRPTDKPEEIASIVEPLVSPWKHPKRTLSPEGTP